MTMRFDMAPEVEMNLMPLVSEVPAALNRDRATMSLGCAGMRVFTGVPEDLMLAVIPRGRERRSSTRSSCPKRPTSR